jgi:uncharacterized protein with FMN-binding domain
MNSPTATSRSTVLETVSGRLLGKNVRRALLSIHITLACIWIGALVVTLLLVGVQITNPSMDWRPGLDRAVLLIYDTLVVNASYGFIVTGLLFSLFTHWGAFRYWWVSVKWVLLAMLGLSLPILVAPHISAMTALSDAYSGNVLSDRAYTAHANAVVFTTIAQLVILVGVVVLSVVKPWGRRKAHHEWPRRITMALVAMILIGLAFQLWIQNVQLERYRKLPVPVIDVSMLRDGTYDGTETQANFTYGVRVTVSAGRISNVEVLDNRDTHYSQLAALVVDKLIQRRNNDIDAISGATTTSKGLMLAVSNALESAPYRDNTEKP